MPVSPASIVGPSRSPLFQTFGLSHNPGGREMYMGDMPEDLNPGKPVSLPPAAATISGGTAVTTQAAPATKSFGSALFGGLKDIAIGIMPIATDFAKLKLTSDVQLKSQQLSLNQQLQQQQLVNQSNLSNAQMARDAAVQQGSINLELTKMLQSVSGNPQGVPAPGSSSLSPNTQWYPTGQGTMGLPANTSGNNSALLASMLGATSSGGQQQQQAPAKSNLIPILLIGGAVVVGAIIFLSRKKGK